MRDKPLTQHNTEISSNLKSWENKPLLRKIYARFHEEIALALGTSTGKDILELGSGVGAIKSTLPECITSDIFKNPWIDRVENAYNLNFPDDSLNGIILFDVWHHLEYPGLALKEFSRVLREGGKVVLFEPAMGWLGRLVYGCFHHEPLGLDKSITWEPEAGQQAALNYYAAQGNCWRMFHNKSGPVNNYPVFDLTDKKLMSAITYIASGGFSKPQMYPTAFHPLILRIEWVLDKAPSIFATRMLVVLTKATTAT